MTFEVVEYLDVDGRSPFGVCFSVLDVHAATKSPSAIRRTDAGNLGDVKSFQGILR